VSDVSCMGHGTWCMVASDWLLPCQTIGFMKRPFDATGHQKMEAKLLVELEKNEARSLSCLCKPAPWIPQHSAPDLSNPATSEPGLSSPLPDSHRDWAPSC
jgi:hypothetical protein